MKILFDKVYKDVCQVYFIKSFRKFDIHFSDILRKFFNFYEIFWNILRKFLGYYENFND